MYHLLVVDDEEKKSVRLFVNMLNLKDIPLPKRLTVWRQSCFAVKIRFIFYHHHGCYDA